VPSAVSDALADLLRDGARQMPAAAVEAEVQEFLTRHQALRDDQGRQRVVRLSAGADDPDRNGFAVRALDPP
jgi:hypothetical protein